MKAQVSIEALPKMNCKTFLAATKLQKRFEYAVTPYDHETDQSAEVVVLGKFVKKPSVLMYGRTRLALLGPTLESIVFLLPDWIGVHCDYFRFSCIHSKKFRGVVDLREIGSKPITVK